MEICTASKIAWTAFSFTGRPSKAPFKSTTCSHSKPWLSNSSACAAGSALNTVACAISPWRSRTHCPSLRSIAGNKIIAAPFFPSPLAGEGFPPRSCRRSLASRMAERVRGEGQLNSSAVCMVQPPSARAKARACSPARGEQKAKRDSSRSTRSWAPFEEIGDQLKPELLALLGMELAPGHIVLGDERGDGAAIVGGGDQRLGARGHEMIGVHEIGVETCLAGRDALEQSVLACEIKRVPAHMRDLERGIAGRDRPHLAFDPAEPWRQPMFKPAHRHELKADADAEKRFPALPHGLFKGFDHAGNIDQALAAIGEGADARQHDALGLAQILGLGRHFDGEA